MTGPARTQGSGTADRDLRDLNREHRAALVRLAALLVVRLAPKKTVAAQHQGDGENQLRLEPPAGGDHGVRRS